MSAGTAFALGLIIGVLATTVVFAFLRPSRVSTPPAGELVTQVSEETLARARDLVARGKIVHAVKAVREETGWDLVRAKAVVDTLPRSPRDDGASGLS
jgi:ribosomal protein L7/L12